MLVEKFRIGGRVEECGQGVEECGQGVEVFTRVVTSESSLHFLPLLGFMVGWGHCKIVCAMPHIHMVTPTLLLKLTPLQNPPRTSLSLSTPFSPKPLLASKMLSSSWSLFKIKIYFFFFYSFSHLFYITSGFCTHLCQENHGGIACYWHVPLQWPARHLHFPYQGTEQPEVQRIQGYQTLIQIDINMIRVIIFDSSYGNFCNIFSMNNFYFFLRTFYGGRAQVMLHMDTRHLLIMVRYLVWDCLGSNKLEVVSFHKYISC